MTQLGPKTRVRIGSNLESNFAQQQEIRARMEEIKEYVRVNNLLQQHLDGKVSALSVTYKEIADDPTILNNVTPISREPDINGKIILWEGYATEKPDFFSSAGAARGPLHRVVLHPDGHKVYCKYNSVKKEWIICKARLPDGTVVDNRFPKPTYGRKASEDWEGVGSNTVARSVMSPKGKVERREYRPASTNTIKK